MSAATRPIKRRKRHRRCWILFASLAILLGLYQRWLYAPWFGRDMFDDSLVIEERWVTLHGRTVENGRAYDQARLELREGSELVLPVKRDRSDQLAGSQGFQDIAVEIRKDGEPGFVMILLEKQHSYHGHPPESSFLRDDRTHYKVWNRQVGSALTVDVDPGGGTIEGSSTVRVIFIVPPDQRLRQEPPTSPAFAGRYDRGWPVSDDDSKAAGWEEVPQKPLSHKQFR
jgi:hypothetical protein